jgi:hypothetical protein
MIDKLILKELALRSPHLATTPHDLFYYSNYYNRLLRKADTIIDIPPAGYYKYSEPIEEERSKNSTWDFYYYINEIGFRDQYPSVKESDILSFFGCSFTYGVGVPTENTFYKNIAGDNSFLNLGDPGASTQKIALIFLAACRVWKIKTAVITLPPWFRFGYTDKANNFMPIVASDDPYSSKETEQVRLALHRDFSDQYHYASIRDSLSLILETARTQNINLIIGSWDSETLEIIEAVTGYKGPLWDWQLQDRGRDKLHPGINSHALYGKLIKSYLDNKQFVVL